MTACQACGVAVNAEVERMVGRMLAGLDERRRTILAETYQGQAPECICARCFLAAVPVMNAAVPAARCSS